MFLFQMMGSCLLRSFRPFSQMGILTKRNLRSCFTPLTLTTPIMWILESSVIILRIVWEIMNMSSLHWKLLICLY
ncbi:hypothetical protein GDO81_016062 [Engystomops pustulosus]|uniref:Uncharacterized protein n=1 Tax=Engystomops pustulosus TaxID=76066 RepID=A0AAV7ATR3_ENGPU|nr:hypothetical protein GDO81_016062 [Engystomops pustulosus]